MVRNKAPRHVLQFESRLLKYRRRNTSVTIVYGEEGHRFISVEMRYRFVGVLHAIPPRRIL